MASHTRMMVFLVDSEVNEASIPLYDEEWEPKSYDLLELNRCAFDRVDIKDSCRSASSQTVIEVEEG